MSYTALCERFGVNYGTVRNICRAYETKGESGLVPDYSACGRRADVRFERGYRLVRLVKHFHPDWGVAYITTRIRERFPELALLSDRQYQRRLKADMPKVALPAPKLPRQSPQKPKLPHDEWQLDAKERMVLEDGSEGCYLNCTDTKSHAMLKGKAFPPGAH